MFCTATSILGKVARKPRDLVTNLIPRQPTFQDSMTQVRSSISTLLFSVALLAHVLILVEYAFRMWQKPHYQFFPMLFLVIGYLFFTAPKRYRTCTGRRPGIYTFVSMVGIFVLLLLATILNSPFIGILSFLWLVCTAIGTLFGRESLLYMSRFLWILIFVVPWPLNLNERLTQIMQFWASGLASTFLDALGFIHFREGVVICTTDDRFLTEEACSGIRSLFSALATVALFGYFKRRSLLRQIVNSIQTFFWVVVGNAIRITIVVITAEYGVTFFAGGIGHQLLGLLMFGVIVLLAISTDKLFSFAILNSRYFKDAEDNDYDFAGDDRMVMDSGSPSKLGGGGDARLNPQSAIVTWLLIGLFGLVVGLSIRLAVVRQPYNNASMLGVTRLDAPVESDLPAEINGWALKSFHLDYRGTESLFAAYSYIWIYEKGNLKASLSLDCPYPSWHDLNVCYTGIGWNCQSDHFFDDRTKDSEAGSKTESWQKQDFSRINMSKPDGTRGLVLFTAVDRSKTVVVPGIESGYLAEDSVVDFFLNKLSLALMLRGDDVEKLSGRQLPITGLQLMSTSGMDLDPSQQTALRELFFEARRNWLASERFANVE